MKSLAFLLIALGFSFSCAFKNEKRLAKAKSGKIASLFLPFKIARKENIPDPTTPQEVKPLTKCERLHNQALAKKKHGATTIYVPQCKADGGFEPEQCYGSIGYCWCVDKNGNEIPGTRTKFGHVPPLECNQESHEKRQLGEGQTKLPAESENMPYRRMALTTNFKRRAETKCEKLRADALAKIKKGEIFVLVPECKADGSFNPVQCDQRFSVNFANCWCVDKNGTKIPGTEISVGFGHNKPPVCSDGNPNK